MANRQLTLQGAASSRDDAAYAIAKFPGSRVADIGLNTRGFFLARTEWNKGFYADFPNR
jgi:hypothetical protein